jgi:hypothetical protein
VDPAQTKRTAGASAAILAAWAMAAGIFACSRIPFYDEWFSITLARDTTWPEFEAALTSDVHPPWLALLDRTLIALCPDRRILCLPRLAASMAAILILRRVVARHCPRVGVTAATLAAFHPIVFMYAGAVRWYPFAFLADALRAWGLWGTSDRRNARLAFVSGAVLGVMSGYAEIVLAAVDAAWLVGRSRDRRAATTVAMAGAGAMATVLAAPLVPVWHRLPGPGAGSALRSLLAWAAPGPLASVVAPWPWAPIVLLAVPGLVWAVGRALANPPRSPLSWWVATTALSWAALATNGVRQPRYSLALWYLTTCSLGLLRGSTFASAARLATTSYLGLALWLTIRQHDFVFDDCNEMTPSDCMSLVPQERTLVVTSYDRTAEELRRVCHTPDVVSSRNAMIYAPDGDLVPIREALVAGPVTFVHANAQGTLLADANHRIRQLLAARCQLEEVHEVAPSPLAALRGALAPGSTFHFASERWRCSRPIP